MSHPTPIPPERNNQPVNKGGGALLIFLALTALGALVGFLVGRESDRHDPSFFYVATLISPFMGGGAGALLALIVLVVCRNPKR
jgi:hypothetical protein